MSPFKESDVVFATTDGRRCANRELAEEIQFWLDIEQWLNNNPIDRELEIQPDPRKFVSWLHAHRKSLAMLIGRMHDSRPSFD